MKLEQQLQEPYAAWKAAPGPETANTLLEAVNPIINHALSAYGGKSAKSPTLRSRARSLAVDSFPAYNPSRGSMRNHLLSNLQRIRRYVGEEQQVLRMPEQVALHRKLLEESGHRMEDDLGRPPSDLELADYTGLSLTRIAHVRKGIRPISEGQLSKSINDPNFVPNVAAGDNSDAWVEFVHSDMSPRDQIILERSMGLHGHKPTSLTDIAKHLKVTPAAISQRLQVIQKALDRREELGVL